MTTPPSFRNTTTDRCYRRLGGGVGSAFLMAVSIGQRIMAVSYATEFDRGEVIRHGVVQRRLDPLVLSDGSSRAPAIAVRPRLLRLPAGSPPPRSPRRTGPPRR